MAESRNTNSIQQRTLGQQVLGLAKTQQFYWFVGHLCLIASFGFNVVESLFSSRVKYYRYGLLSIIFTYVIVIKQIHFKNKASIQKITFTKLLRDENIQYLFLSIWCYMMSFTMGKITGCLYSFNIYSVFHLIHYFQNNLLNYLPFNLTTQQSLNNTLNQFSGKFNQSALILAANSEIFMLVNLVVTSPLLLFKLFSRGGMIYIVCHVLTMVILAVFLKFRFTNNSFTNTLFKQYDYNIETFLNNPQLTQRFPALSVIPPKYNAIKSLVIQKLSIFDPTPKKS